VKIGLQVSEEGD